MDQCRRLQRLPRFLLRHFGHGKFSQLIVYKRQKFRCRFGIAVLYGIQDLGDAY